jgi:ADP-heptose:LPS heptosyltransferase
MPPTCCRGEVHHVKINVNKRYGKNMQTSNPTINWHRVKNVAVISRAMNGDLILTDTLLLYLRRVAPQAKITLFANSQNAQLLPYLKNFDDYEILPARGEHNFRLFKIAMQFRKRKLDVVINDKISRPSKCLNVFMWLLGAKYRIGYIAQDWTAKLINCGTEFVQQAIMENHRNILLLRLLDKKINFISVDLFPQLKISDLHTNSVHGVIDRFLESEPNCPTVLISLINNRVHSTISEQKYIATLNESYKRIKFKVIVSCKANCDNLLAALLMPAISVLTPCFPDFMYVLSQVDCVYVGEGGVMNMASALNKRSLSLFGETPLIHWHPLAKNKTIYLEVDTPGLKKNVNNIDNDRIVKKLVEILS